MSTTNYERLPDFEAGTVPPSSEPQDRRHSTYLAYVLIGTGVLFPWNIIISAVDFFDDLFPGQDALFFFSIAYQTTNLVGLLLMIKYGSHYLFKHRILPGFLIATIVMAAIPFSPYLWLTIGLTGVFGFTNALLQGSLFGLVGIYSAKYMSAFMTGQGVSGLAAALLRCLSKGALPEDSAGIRLGARIFFGVACFIMVLCVLSYVYILEPSAVTMHFASYASPSIRNEFSPATGAKARHLRTAETVAESPELPMRLLSRQRHDMRHGNFNSTNVLPRNLLNDFSGNETQKPIENDVLIFSPPLKAVSYWDVLCRIRWMAFTVFFAFLVSLSLFPGFTAELKSTNDKINLSTGSGWFPLILVTLFNLGDFIGRSIPNVYMWSSKWAVIGGVVRVIFFPLFVFSYLQFEIHNDWYVYGVMLAFSISNGFISTLSMIYGTGDIVPNSEKDAAGTLMVFFLTLGLAGGVWFGYGLKIVVDLLNT